MDLKIHGFDGGEKIKCMMIIAMSAAGMVMITGMMKRVIPLFPTVMIVLITVVMKMMINNKKLYAY